jgi:hypothetical protein
VVLPCRTKARAPFTPMAATTGHRSVCAGGIDERFFVIRVHQCPSVVILLLTAWFRLRDRGAVNRLNIRFPQVAFISNTHHSMT